MTLVRRVAAALTAAILCGTILGTAPAATAVDVAPAAGSVKASVSLTGPTSGTYGTTVRLTGTAWRYGTATKLVRATVWLQRATHGRTNWGNVTKTSTSSTGTFAFAIVQSSAYDYRAHYAGSPTYTPAWSPVRYPAVLQKVIFDTIKDVDWNAGTLQATGRVYPTPPAGTQVWLQRYDYTAKAWRNYISGRTAGGNAVTIRGNVPGSVGTYRLSVALRYPYAAGASGSAAFAHYKWRGAFRRPIVGSGGTERPWRNVYTKAESAPQSELEVGADMSGISWVDVNTVGCGRLYLRALNYTNEYKRSNETVGILDLTRYLRGPYLLTPGAEKEAEVASGGLAKMRVQVKDAGTADGPLGYFVVWALCAN